MKTSAEIKFDKIVKEGLHSVLKPLGFKKKANNFYLKLDELGQIINIQKSSFYSKNHIHFTVNTGIFLSEHWKGLIYNRGKEIPAFPAEPQCLIRKRIGVLKSQHDTWYEVDNDTEENGLIDEMKTNLSQYILPYFEQVKTKADALKILQSERLKLDPLGKFIVFAELNETEMAKKEYLRVLKGSVNSDFLKTVKEYGKKYGFE